MPSTKVLEQKKQIVEELIGKLKKSCTGVLVDYKGINVENDTKLRKELREAGVDYFVVKNTLLRFAVNEVELNDLSSVLEGTTSLALSESDYTAAARIISKYIDNKSNFKIKAGFVDGKIVSVSEVETLAKLPSKEVIIGQILYGLNAPITSLAIALKAIAEKKEAEEKGE